MVSILIEDTKDEPPFKVAGVTPCHEMNMLITMVRDLPLKKPLPEPGMEKQVSILYNIYALTLVSLPYIIAIAEKESH